MRTNNLLAPPTKPFYSKLPHPQYYYLPSSTNPTHLALPQVDGEVDELAVFHHQVLQVGRLQELLGLLLEVQGDGRASLQRGTTRIFHDAELTGVRLPDVLLVVVVLGCHHHRVSNWRRREKICKLVCRKRCYCNTVGLLIHNEQCQSWERKTRPAHVFYNAIILGFLEYPLYFTGQFLNIGSSNCYNHTFCKTILKILSPVIYLTDLNHFAATAS